MKPFPRVMKDSDIGWLMKLLQKSTKTHKNEKNEQCACMNIFKRIVGMILIVFVGSNTPLRLLLTRISWPQNPYSKKPPSF